MNSKGVTMIGKLYCHLKSGHIYVVTGECLLEATAKPGVLYRRVNLPDAPLWARDKDEFLDGRFAPVNLDESELADPVR